MSVDPRYLAGVADSDGSFTITKRHTTRVTNNYHCCFQLTWKASPEVRAFMQDLVNEYGGSCTESVKKSNSYGTEIAILRYYSQGSDLDKFLDLVSPYLVLKKDQAQLLREQRKLSPAGLYGNGRKKPPEVIARQEEILRAIRKLNTKNGFREAA